MRRDRMAKLCAMLSLVCLTAAATFKFATVQVELSAPFMASANPWDSLTAGQVGGRVQIANVGGTTDTLLIGDVVYWSDTNRVTKSATLANYNAIAGVVVGGARLTPIMSAAIASTDVGTVAATTGQRVWILKQGRMWMRSSQNAVVIAGRRVIPSDSIAGRWDTTLTAQVIDSAQRMIGRTVTATAALAVGLVDVNIR